MLKSFLNEKINFNRVHDYHTKFATKLMHGGTPTDLAKLLFGLYAATRDDNVGGPVTVQTAAKYSVGTEGRAVKYEYPNQPIPTNKVRYIANGVSGLSALMYNLIQLGYAEEVGISSRNGSLFDITDKGIEACKETWGPTLIDAANNAL